MGDRFLYGLIPVLITFWAISVLMGIYLSGWYGLGYLIFSADKTMGDAEDIDRFFNRMMAGIYLLHLNVIVWILVKILDRKNKGY